MNSVFPFIDIIILGLLAVFLGFRLKNMLGDKSGFNGNISNETRNGDVNNDNKVVSLHKNKEEGHGIKVLKKAYPMFSEEDFKEGAKSAFKIIVNAFSNNDLDSLRQLLGYELLQDFTKAISEKSSDSNEVKTKIDSIESVEILDCSVFDNIASITVKIISIQSKISENPGDDNSEINKEKLKDKWVFEKDLTSNDPNWKLVETDTAE